MMECIIYKKTVDNNLKKEYKFNIVFILFIQDIYEIKLTSKLEVLKSVIICGF